jgi:UDP:flavonoid glycosyltransferase YjiC (YdhE family)
VTTDYDVLLASDLRFPGGTSASLAEEVRAQAAGGYRTGLVQVFGPLVARPHPVNPLLRACVARGHADLLPPTATARAPLAVLRHPGIFQQAPRPSPVLTVERVLLVANQPAVSASGEVHYDPELVDRVVLEWLGHRPLWAPIGPLVRSTLAGAAIELRAQDWVNLIDVDEWAADRSARRGPVPVIGRHSRPQPAKWPATAQDLLAAYPEDGSVRVRILGGAGPAVELLGELPAAWQVEEFGARHPREFLADIDFFVYYHHPDWVEAFGRTVMEALASGAVAVLPPALRRSFGAAALYAEPHEAMAVVRRLHADPAAYAEQSRRGQRWVRDRHGPEAHLRRLREVSGGAGPRGTAPAASPGPYARDTAATVLFLSSNGAGMGHLTRLLAMARRAGPRVRPLFLSLSQAVPVVERDGFPYEYFPSRTALQIPPGEWNRLFAARFRQALAEHRPGAVVFDGTWPYQGIVDVRPEFPGTRFVWSRRAMWKADTPPDQLAKSSSFDLVLEPGELAAGLDRGPTTTARDARKLRPVTYLGAADLLPRAQAAAELGLDPDRETVLVTLGAGTINDLRSDLGIVTAALAGTGAQVVLTQPMIAGVATALDADVHRVSVYPLSRYSRAFDAAVAAAGYNSFHELVAFAVPTLFLPNLHTRTDDQLARARWAAEAGVGLCATQVTAQEVEPALHRLLDPVERAAMAARCRAVYPGNGARDGMAAIEELLAGSEVAR